MTENTFEHDLMQIVRGLNESQQRDVLNYARSVSGKPKGTPGAVVIERLKAIHISDDDLDEMKRVIEEDCERIDRGDWDANLFD